MSVTVSHNSDSFATPSTRTSPHVQFVLTISHFPQSDILSAWNSRAVQRHVCCYSIQIGQWSVIHVSIGSKEICSILIENSFNYLDCYRSIVIQNSFHCLDCYHSIVIRNLFHCLDCYRSIVIRNSFHCLDCYRSIVIRNFVTLWYKIRRIGIVTSCYGWGYKPSQSRNVIQMLTWCEWYYRTGAMPPCPCKVSFHLLMLVHLGVRWCKWSATINHPNMWGQNHRPIHLCWAKSSKTDSW